MAKLFIPAFILSIVVTTLNIGKTSSLNIRESLPDTFCYFAYGPNLLEQHLRRSCPSAVRRSIGRLHGFILGFQGYSDKWHGARATIIPTRRGEIWGATWKMNNTELPILDKDKSGYFRVPVIIQLWTGIMVPCITYESHDFSKNLSIPLPSKVYLDTIRRGANESHLPVVYQKLLEILPHNDYDGEVDYDN